MVVYPQADYSPGDIWMFLLSLQEWLQREGHADGDHKTIQIKREGSNRFVRRDGEIILEVGDASRFRFQEERFEPDPIEFPATIAPIRRVRLGFFRTREDPRWDSLRLPSSLIFLASALHVAGFQVQVAPIPAGPEAGQLDERPDLLGFTLYEENFPEIQQYLNELRGGYNGLVAAGGPMVTLASWPAAFHLPQVNLLVRGEADAVLARILLALNSRSWTGIWQEKGFLFQNNGLLIISDFDHINRMEASDLSSPPFTMAFTEKSHLMSGLEINFSRGCRRGCLFCSHVHGKDHRKLSVSAVQNILRTYNERRLRLGIDTRESAAVNINDDDILQDKAWAADVLRLIRAEGLRIWGVQTALCSLVSNRGRVDSRLLDLLAEPDLYAGGRPLLWVGTDTFLPERAKRLGKAFPQLPGLEDLFFRLEERGVYHYHYWISSDAETSWEEFIRELDLIAGFLQRFHFFKLLPHAPFLVPYATTPIYRELVSRGMQDQIKLKKCLSAADPRLAYPLVLRVETRYENLNRILYDEPPPGGGAGSGFFSALKARNFHLALKTLYYFLRQERLQAESAGNGYLAGALKKNEVILETRMAECMEKRGS